MSADESVTRPLPVTPVSTATGQNPERYNEASLIHLITDGCSVSAGSAPSWNETKCSDETPVWFNTPLEMLKMKHSPLLDFSASAEGMFFFVEVTITNDSTFPPAASLSFPFALMGM